MHDRRVHDNFSQEMPWENEKVIAKTDWQDEPMVVGCVYYKADGEYVHEDEIMDYVNDNFPKVEVDADSRL